MKIAVIGGGLAGLSAAWLLGKQHAVTLIERHAAPGFTAHSVSVPGLHGTEVRVDVPIRVFYPGYYPTLMALYAALGVESEPVSYAATFTGADGRPYFRYRNLRWRDISLGWLGLRDWRLPRARPIVAGMLRFRRALKAAARAGALEEASLGEFVDRGGFADAFVEGFLLPSISTVCTCPHAVARAFPASVIADYLERGLTREAVRRAVHGADAVQQRLLAGIGALRCGVTIAAVRRTGEGTVEIEFDAGRVERFDHVVLATQANQARRLLHDAAADEAAMLDGFRYLPIEVVMHRDTGLMPVRRADWSPINLMVEPRLGQPESTIWVNAVQPALRGAADVFQTVHPLRVPRPELVISRAGFERPVVDRRSQAALIELKRLHGQAGRRVWFCGSYARAGVPLLESAVRSAFDVAEALNSA
jgi:predicted NAD/FAD-binding protein